MKKLLATSALCGSLLLGGCATTGGQLPPAADIIAQVRAITQQACQFIPLGQVVLDIVAKGEFVAPVAIANAICDALSRPITAAQRGTKAGRPTVSGVVIRGSYSKKR